MIQHNGKLSSGAVLLQGEILGKKIWKKEEIMENVYNS